MRKHIPSHTKSFQYELDMAVMSHEFYTKVGSKHIKQLLKCKAEWNNKELKHKKHLQDKSYKNITLIEQAEDI